MVSGDITIVKIEGIKYFLEIPVNTFLTHAALKSVEKIDVFELPGEFDLEREYDILPPPQEITNLIGIMRAKQSKED